MSKPAIKHFTVDARTILQLGRDSIKDFTTALIELVKNCYDADATDVELGIFQTKGEPHIRVADNGFGMTEEVIDDNWLRIGFSEKRKVKRSAKKRRKTGEKGIGRIAADRLGKELTLLTISEDGDPQGLKVKWDLFDVDNKSIDEIPIAVIPSPKPDIPKKARHGTEILIRGLRQTWSLTDLDRLYNELSTLTSPFTAIENDSFRVRLMTDVDPKYSDMMVRSTFSDSAEIELSFEYDGKSPKVSYYIENRRLPGEEFIEKVNIKQLINATTDGKPREPRCGPFSAKLLFFLRDSSVLERSNYTKLDDFKAALDANMGIKIYRDRIAVKPYGYPDSVATDWLGLGERKQKNPAGVGRKSYVLGPNQILGAVFIGRDDNPNLLDSAGREGLVEGDGFLDLKQLVMGAIQVLEAHRVEQYNPQKENRDTSTAVTNHSHRKSIESVNAGLGSVQDMIQEANALVGEGQSPVSERLVASSRKMQAVKEEVNETFDEMLNQARIMNGLSTLGITAAVFGHETQSAVSIVKLAASTAHGALSISPPNTDTAKSELEKVRRHIKHVGNWGLFALSRVQISKRQNPQPQRIQKLIKQCVSDVEAVFEGADVKVEVDIVDEVMSRVYPMDIEAILFNLLTNAYQACLQVNRERTIRIRLQRENRETVKGFSIEVIDNGPGIASEFIQRIWEPLFTTKMVKGKGRTGTGLGLTIVESIVSELKGTATAQNSKELNGARFCVWIPKDANDD